MKILCMIDVTCLLGKESVVMVVNKIEIESKKLSIKKLQYIKPQLSNIYMKDIVQGGNITYIINEDLDGAVS